MRLTKILCTGLLSGVGSVGFACDLPPLVAIPAKADVGDKGPQVGAEVAAYVELIRTYTACVQADLAAAGGDSAPAVVKAVLVNRHNLAAAEVQAVLKQYNESIGADAAGQPPPPGGGDSSRRRNRNE